MDPLRLRGLSLATALLLALPVSTPSSASTTLQKRSGDSPSLILDPTSLADEVDPGDIFAVLDGIAIFWLDELDYQGTDHIGDDTVRLALWRTDGSAQGTYPLLPPEVSFYYYWPDSLNGVLYFAVCRPNRPISAFSGAACERPEWVELWRTDGSKEGTFRVLHGKSETLADIYLGPSRYGSSGQIVPQLGEFFFLTSEDKGADKIWATDGTQGGTRLVETADALGVFGFVDLRNSNGTLYFYGYKSVAPGSAVWIGRSDGTSGGTEVFPADLDGDRWMKTFIPAPDRLFVVSLSDEQERHPVTGRMVSRRTLWSVERGNRNFRWLADLGLTHFGSVVRAKSTDDLLYIEVENLKFAESTGEVAPYFEVWASDGTPTRTELVGASDQPDVNGHIWVDPASLPEGRALLSLSDDIHGVEPWISDGTAQGTEILADICPGECDSHPIGAALFGGSYYLTAEGEGYDRELWSWSPSNDDVKQAVDFCPGSCGGYPQTVEMVQGRWFMRALDSDRERRVWEVLPGGHGGREVTDFPGSRLGGSELVFNRGRFPWRVVGSRAVYWARVTENNDLVTLWSMPAPSAEPLPPEEGELTSEELPGFSVKVLITPRDDDPILGSKEDTCIPETLCVSGAVEGRAEVFVRVVGPKPNGKLWPTLVKFSTSTVDVWIKQSSTGIVRHYRLDGATPTSSELPGLFDRRGFSPSGSP